jgi:hypothetical protein
MSNLATIVNNILADSGIDDINVVVTTGSYTNPAWIVSLPWTKITGAPAFVTNVTATSPLFSSGGTTPNLTIQQSSGSLSGFLSSTDWNTFNNKANANGSNASGTWPISITGSAGSAAFNNLTDKTGGTGTYQTSGDFRAPIFYDSAEPGYYMDFNAFSNIRALSTGGGYTNFGVFRSSPSDNFGNGRTYLRVHATSSGTRIMSFKIIINSSWNYVDSFGFVSADVSFYFDGTNLYAPETTITSATGRARLNLNIGQPVIENGFVSIPIFSSNTNPIAAYIIGGLGADYTTFTFTSWESVAFPGTSIVSVPGPITIGGLLTVDNTANLNGRVNIGNSLTRPAALNSDSVAQARIGGTDVHLYVASLGATAGFKVALQAARQSDFQSFDLDLQSNGGTLRYGGIEVVRNTGLWGISVTGSAGSTNLFTSYGGGITTQAGSGTIIYQSALAESTTGLFPTSDNSNSIITLSRHPDNYYSQLGFNSTGSIFYRSFNATAINTTQPWQTLLTSSNFSSYALPLTGGTLTGPLNGTSASFSSDLTISSTGNAFLVLNNTTPSTGRQWRVSSGSNGSLFFTQVGVVDALTIAPSTGAATFSSSVTSTGLIVNGAEFYYAPANYTSGGFTRLLGRNASTGRIEGMSAADIQSFIGLGNYLPLTGGTLTGPLTISTVEDGKLILRAPSGDTSEWNYINFVGTNGVRDAYFGTDGGGIPTWYRDDNGVNIQLGSVATVNGVQIVTNSGTWSINITGASRYLNTIDGSLTTQPGNGLISYSSAITHPQTGLFPAIDNSNSILTLNRHPDNYYSQLGFSSNGQLYYRSFSATAINTSQAWQNLLTNTNYNSYAPTLTGGGASGTWGISVSGTANSETLSTVTNRGATTSNTLNLEGRVNIGNGLTRPAALNSDAVAQARIGGADVHLYVASLNAPTYKVAMQAARTSDFASFDLDLQSNGGTLRYGGIEVVRNSGTWGINVTGSAGSVTHNSGRTDAAWYNVGWFSGNPSPAYSCNAVQIKSDEGGIRANYYYDNQNTGYYLRPSGFSNLRTVHIDGFTQFAQTTPSIPANFGNGRVHLRVHPVSSGSRIMSFKIMISSTWNWADAFGFISADVSFYFDGSGFYAATTTITSATGRARLNLNIGQPVIENGFVSIPIFSVNSNSVFVKMEGAPSFDWNAVSYGPWESVAFPGAAIVNIPGAVLLTNNLTVTGSSSFNNLTLSSYGDGMLTLRTPSDDSNEWNYIQFVLRSGTRRAYIGLDNSGVPQWSRDDNGLTVSLGSTFTVNGGVTATAFFESSDKRLKSNILDLDVNVSSIIAKTYLKNGVAEIGYLAQDVETILPSAISKRDDGYLDLSYRQVHTAKIAALEKEVKELKEQLKNK